MRTTIDHTFVAMLLAGSAVATAVLIVLMRPLLERYALARPNARSSHSIPTPQGGGIAIVVTVATVIASCAYHGSPAFREPWLLSALLAAVGLAAIGALDDIRPLPVLPRFVLQVAAASLLILTLPPDIRVLPQLPVLVERPGLIIGLVWFINLTNFMDGIDWMTVVETIPIYIVLVGVCVFGLVPKLAIVLPVMVSLLGAVIGFAPFNRHVAKLFLGDVGSLPIGALTGWLLILLAASGHLFAALILPLYYLADATITLLRRLVRRERLSQAHRTHFYQLATQRGFTVNEVTARVFALNILLGALAVAAIIVPVPMLGPLALLAGCLATGFVLSGFAKGRST